MALQLRAEVTKGGHTRGRPSEPLRPASKRDAAACAEALMRGPPTGFAQFTGRLLQMYRQHGIEVPTVTVEYKALNVKMQVCTGWQLCPAASPA